MARVAVAGGGFGGLAVAARLAKQGHTVTVVEKADRLGGALGLVERDGFTWDAGPSRTLVPAVLRDLFRKTGRSLERELDLVPLDPAREHRFEDGTVVTLPSGSRAAQKRAIDAGLGDARSRRGGTSPGDAWLAWTAAHADVWDAVRRDLLERPYDAGRAPRATRDLFTARTSLARAVRKALPDQRLRTMALHATVMDGHDPRDVPAWAGLGDYVEQSFGTWSVPGGLGRLATVLGERLATRGVRVLLGTTVRDVVVRDGRAVGLTVDGVGGPETIEAEHVVCAVDPRRLPLLAPYVERTMPAIPPVITHLGVDHRPDEPPPPEIVLHGDPLLVLRTTGTGPEGASAWTLLARGRIAEDPLEALARAGVDLRQRVVTRVDLTPRHLVEQWGGSPHGVLWQGRGTMAERLGPATPVPGVWAVGAHTSAASAGSGLPSVGMSAAQVAELVGRA